MAPADELPDNWGRWGEDDESGTLNLITDAVRARAAAEVCTGRTVSLALPVSPAPIVMGPFAPDTVPRPADGRQVTRWCSGADGP